MSVLPKEYALEDRTVGRILAIAAAQMGDKPLVIDVDGDAISYREMDSQANRMARGLAAFGVHHQEPVAFMLNDTIDLTALFCGLARRGAVEVPINLAYRGPFLSRIINDSCAKVLVVDAQFLERLAAIAPELESLERCVIYPRRPDQVPAAIAERFELFDFSTLSADDDSPFDGGPSYSDMIGIMYTSGTTGTSKGVMVSHAHAYRYGNNVGSNHGVVETDNYYTAGLPLFHIAGQWGVVYASMMTGATVILRRGYRNEYFWSDIATHGGTVVFMLGAIANFIWQQAPRDNDIDTPLAKVGMYPVIPEHEAFAKRFGVQVASGYGSTENPGPCRHALGLPFPTNQCVGLIKDTVDCKILDENDVECAPGVVGEICVRPHNAWEIMMGYWRQPEATLKAFRNLWFHSGDAGFIDKQQRLYFVDRVTDSMRRRGENISSMEVEDIINQHADVLECAVFPVWADESEQDVMVTITPQPDTRFDPVALTRFCNERMPYFMVPRYVDVVDSIPKTPTGKIQKYALRKQGITDETWDRVAAGVKLER
jgi:crotonobetaine/carnitine-CoA ligase